MKERESWLLRFRKSPAHTQTNIVCTAIIAFATVAYTVVAGFQLSAMRDTLAEMTQSGNQATQQMWSAIGNVNWLARSADWSQKVAHKQASDTVGEMQKQTAAQMQSAQTAEDTVKTARDQMRMDQRAWIAVKDVHGASTSPMVTFINTGRTPALDVKVYARRQWTNTKLTTFTEETRAQRLGMLSPETERNVLYDPGPAEGSEKPLLYVWELLLIGMFFEHVIG